METPIARSRSRSRAVLRGAGLEVSVGSTIDFARALDCVGLATASGVYWAGRATLVRRPDDIASYDRAFDAFWNQGGVAGALDDADEPAVPLDRGLRRGAAGARRRPRRVGDRGRR